MGEGLFSKSPLPASSKLKKKPLWIESHIVQFPPILPKKKKIKKKKT
jgi:hypothetical protein